MKTKALQTCLMLALAVLLVPAPGYSFREKPEDVIEDSCTGGAKKILITYDTTHGATALVAQSLFYALCDNATVDLVFVENLDPAAITGYDAVIIGSPVYMGKWRPGIQRLLRWHHAKIAQIPAAFFITCTYLKDENDTPERRQKAYDLYIKKVLARYPDIMPVSTGILSGEFQFAELFPLERFLMKLAGFDEGDFRNEDKIEAWAREVWEKIQ